MITCPLDRTGRESPNKDYHFVGCTLLMAISCVYFHFFKVTWYRQTWVNEVYGDFMARIRTELIHPYQFRLLDLIVAQSLLAILD